MTLLDSNLYCIPAKNWFGEELHFEIWMITRNASLGASRFDYIIDRALSYIMFLNKAQKCLILLISQRKVQI